MATAITTTGGIKLNALGESIRGSLQKTPGDWFGYTTTSGFVEPICRLISLGLKQIVACGGLCSYEYLSGNLSEVAAGYDNKYFFCIND
jgi:hypothetical protein